MRSLILPQKTVKNEDDKLSPLIELYSILMVLFINKYRYIFSSHY